MKGYIGYRPEIDGLRALAVLAVMLYHSGISLFSGGFIGVDVFFVISGYLITSHIKNDLQTGSFSLLNFYERRARRILPALFFVALICIPVALLVLPPLDMYEFGRSLVAFPLFVSNYLFWQESGYFATDSELKPLMHTWSLGVEEQFYLVVPLCLMLAWRTGRHGLTYFVVSALLASLVAAQLALADSREASFYLLPYRGWELLLGSSVALLSPYLAERVNLSVGRGLAALGISLLLVGIFAYDDATPFPGLAALVPTIATASILMFSSRHSDVGKLLAQPQLVGIGLISYSAYLWHQPLLAFARQAAEQKPSAIRMLSLLFLSLVLAWCSWKYIEMPFRRTLLADQAKFAKSAAVVTAFFLGVGFFILDNDGLPDRFHNEPVYEGDIGESEYFGYMAKHSYPCFPQKIAVDAPDWEGFSRCRQSQPDDEIDVAVIGDSHAEHIFLGVAALLPERNVVYYIDSSRFLLGNLQAAAVYDHVLRTESIRTVFIAMNWRRRMHDGSSEEADLGLDLTNTLERLAAVGKTVYLLADTPVFPFGATRCKYVIHGPLGSTSPRCDENKSEILKDEADYLSLLRRAVSQVSGVRFAEPRDAFCDDTKCSMVKNGMLMYRDDEHLNIHGSLQMRQVLADLFPDLAD